MSSGYLSKYCVWQVLTVNLGFLDNLTFLQIFLVCIWTCSFLHKPLLKSSGVESVNVLAQRIVLTFVQACICMFKYLWDDSYFL